MGPGDFLKVTYKGRNVKQKDGSVKFDDTTPYNFQWDSRTYTAEPGKETFVPWEAVSVAMGDPRSTDTVSSSQDESGVPSFVVDRPTELRRLVILYDNEVDDDNTLPLYAPQADVADLEGNEVKTVLHDPKGESVTPAQTTVLDRDQLLAQIQRQQKMIQQLAEEQGIDMPSEDDTTTTDKPASDPFASVPEG